MRTVRKLPLRTLLALSLGVTLAHLWLAGQALPPRIGDGAADREPRRIEIAFVRELAPAEPPAAAPVPPAAVRRLPSRLAPAVPAAASAASAAEPLLPERNHRDPDPAAVDQPLASLETLPELAALPPIAAGDPDSAAQAASAANPALEWPPSTRLSYRLSGNYRGPVEGQAQVEWLREGLRYQVFMDLSIGPSFAPLVSRRVSSEGRIGPDGLHPLRYDEVTKAVLAAVRRKGVELGEETIRLDNGNVEPRPAGVQDSASQFVQLTWLFTTRPALLTPGSQIMMPLALPHRVESWTYDVLASETLPTPAGPVDAVHVKPRREPKPGRDLTAEVWVAPSLQYLPVRILIRQDAETFLDLVIDRLPQQAAAAAPAASR
ncbi:MAG: DUF3108 domain-containing protein [Rubrivivax sp.]